MAHVMVLDSLNKDIFVCGNCKSVYNSLPSYLEHKSSKCKNAIIDQSNVSEHLQPASEANYDSKDLYTAPQQNEAVTVKEDYVSSMANKQTCKFCFKKFKTLKSLLGHARFHEGKCYQCPICGRCFFQNSHLQRHIVSHKMWPSDVQDRTPKSVEDDLLSYTCPYCSLLSANFNKFRLHMKCHTSLKQYRCLQEGCLSFCDNISALIKHVSEIHSTPIYTCHICNEKFNSLEDIADHQQNHKVFEKEPKSPSKEYKCPKCDAIFKHPEKLSFHIFAENHNKLCTHCNKSFASEKCLRMHLRLHRDSNSFECNICGRIFRLKKYLAAHILRHGTISFQCLICKSMFKREDLLRTHMGSHESKKIYKCTYKDALDCGKEFRQLHKLKAHLKYHANCVSAQSLGEEKCDESSPNSSKKSNRLLDSSTGVK